MKDWEPYTFIQYKWPSHVLGQCILLRVGSNYETKNNAAKGLFQFSNISITYLKIDSIEKLSVFNVEENKTGDFLFFK